MPLVDFEQHELKTIGECLRAVAFGPFLADGDASDKWWEFSTLMGLENAEVAAIAEQWPEVEIQSPDVQTAVTNSMNNLLGYPHHRADAWSAYISVTPREVERVLGRWITLMSQVE